LGATPLVNRCKEGSHEDLADRNRKPLHVLTRRLQHGGGRRKDVKAAGVAVEKAAETSKPR
jgi:hypothetical protein